ncbi:hypothetical protein GYB43_00275 [bacterium]|nr:hypothetical protein [bacterium]
MKSSDKIVPEADFSAANQWVVESGREYVVIDGMESFDPFFLNIVSAGEQWFFCSSDGAPCAGRRSPESALFPYYTVDKIIDNWNNTGPWTAIATEGQLWNPFRPSIAQLAPIKRRLLKSALGDELMFDEVHEDLGLRVSYRWMLSDRFGFVRKVKISNEGDEVRSMKLVDGLDNFLPSGIDSRMQLEYSCLADAYKMSELECDGRLLVHRLASGIVDAPIPLECLRATTVWTQGLEEAQRFLCRRDAEKFLQGKSPATPDRVRAKRGGLFLADELTLAPGESREWMMVAEIEQTQIEIAELRQSLADPDHLCAGLESDLREGRESLREVVASSDGFQQTADRDAALYHYYNVLCNVLRGGVPEKGTTFRKEQFLSYLGVHHGKLIELHGEALNDLPDVLERSQLLKLASSLGDADLIRLAEEYLPLVLSRRHGDPSRPWNRFDIRVKDEAGEAVHHFEGNWRDIFQNWEALAWSYPDFVDGFISKFLNASTIDGYNPYRITSKGIDWEAPDEDDPWVSIGYWGDHQIIYLLKLLELEAKIRPDRLAERLNTPAYVFADVPYRLKSWANIVADPRDTVEFDVERHHKLMALREKVGADGLLLRNSSGELVRATLTEKLLIPALVKLANLVPGGGVWMNTQKPEWNDANNALAGCGLSVVTAGYLMRYVKFLKDLLGEGSPDELFISRPLVRLIQAMSKAFSGAGWQKQDFNNQEGVYSLVEEVGLALEQYRNEVVHPKDQEPVSYAANSVREFLDHSQGAIEQVLQSNQRKDGLWHAYNVLEIGREEKTMGLRRLPVMLEGQVAILSSGCLDSDESLALLEALPSSDLRSQRHPTYLLYPDRELPRFMEINHLGEDQVTKVEALAEMIVNEDERLVVRDPEGGYRFHHSLTNGYELTDAMNAIEGLSSEDRIEIEVLYESVFQHQMFTGRSGSMFGYEGLGCVYWHMVSKLMVAAQEVTLEAMEEGVDAETLRRFAGAYFSVQAGLGYRQSPRQYGAFPAEPYSHSSGQAGAQQPGLTGQVKEGILCRLGELGVDFIEGQLAFRPRLLRNSEFEGLDARPDQAAIPAGVISFTFAGTAVTYHRNTSADTAIVRVRYSTGEEKAFDGILDYETSSEILSRSGKISSIDVQVPASWLIY